MIDLHFGSRKWCKKLEKRTVRIFDVYSLCRRGCTNLVRGPSDSPSLSPSKNPISFCFSSDFFLPEPPTAPTPPICRAAHRGCFAALSMGLILRGRFQDSDESAHKIDVAKLSEERDGLHRVKPYTYC
jgi:hypothetical protein